MIKSLNTGVTGLTANTEAMGIIGDNIANVKTTGFKANRVTFANLLSQTIEGSRVGDGVLVWGTDTSWAQGSPENTGNPTDIAINGNGFFVVKNFDGASYYTRAGIFNFDKSGTLVNPDNLKVQGYKVTSFVGTDITVSGEMTDIQVETGIGAPNPSTKIQSTLNLNSDAAVSDPPFVTTITVYDSLGNSIPLTLSFSKKADNEWECTPSAQDLQVRTTPTPISLRFSTTGQLTGTGPNPIISVTVPNAEPLDIEWELYEDDGTGTLATNGSLSQYATASATTALSQDGFPAGALESVYVNESGFLSGVFSSGETKPLYRLAMATFANLQGLTGKGNSLYIESLSSGPAMVGNAGEGGLGTIIPSSLEMSNVELSEEFVNLITTQRAFQANSKVITTSDEILAELMNLKR